MADEKTGSLWDYFVYRTLEAELAGSDLEFISKPGLENWTEVSPAQHLLAEHVQAAPQARLLLLGGGAGALAVTLANRLPQGEVCSGESSHIALECTRRTLALNGCPNVNVFSLSDLPEPGFDCAAVVLPKGRKLARSWLCAAHLLLKPGGVLYLAGANPAGIQSVGRDAQALFGSPAVALGYKKGSRVMRMEHTELAHLPDWAGEAGILPGSWHTFDLKVGGESLVIHSLPGVFSYDRLDDGTAMLLDNLPDVPGRILDVGCGYGVIGMLLARRNPQGTQVDLVDSNLLAVASASQNLRSNQLANARAFPGDLMLELPDTTYDLVISNPPFHAGQAVDYAVAEALIGDARRVLKPGGQLRLVANRFIRYERLMAQVFGSVEVVAQDNRYHVLAAIKTV
jgi:16S rRNA (guanine1207-N2)-methyltransferase